MEVINNLYHYENLKIVQDSSILKFSLDSLLLANFVTITSNTRKILDIGTGNAPIALALTARTKAKIVGVEIQKGSYDLAVKSVQMNDLQNQITLLHMDIHQYYKEVESDTFDVITCNPPYFKVYENSKTNQDSEKTLARHEISLELEDICHISKKLLKNGGVLSFVHRPERLSEIICMMRKHNIEPKRIQLIFPNVKKEASIVLIEGRKNGKPNLKILPPIYANKEDGSYTDEICSYFKPKE